MSEQQLPLFEPDESMLARDDALLDALGSGVKLPGEDTLAMALFMWREDLTAPPKAVAAERARRKRRRITWGIIAAALAATLGTGATLAAASDARPGSLLWPITQTLFPAKASTVSAKVAKQHITEAQTAVDAKNLPEARKLLDQAEKLIANVISELEKQALITDLQRVRALLDSTLTGLPVPTPAPSAPGQPGQPGQSPAPGPSAGPGGATPGPGKSGGILPLPLPTISIPPLLPSLPLG